MCVRGYISPKAREHNDRFSYMCVCLCECVCVRYKHRARRRHRHRRFQESPASACNRASGFTNADRKIYIYVCVPVLDTQDLRQVQLRATIAPAHTSVHLNRNPPLQKPPRNKKRKLTIIYAEYDLNACVCVDAMRSGGGAPQQHRSNTPRLWRR